MINWTARTRLVFSEMGQDSTDKTDETALLSVLSVPPELVYNRPARLSSVSSVGVRAFFENQQLALDLIDAAMKVCDQHGDGEAARQHMRRDCLALPPHLQADLLDHFNDKPTNLPN